MPDINKPVVILGGGLAVLTAANHLRRQNISVILYEAGSKIAGLAQSFHDDEGFTYDFGAHFITNRLAETVGLRDRCRAWRALHREPRSADTWCKRPVPGLSRYEDPNRLSCFPTRV